MSARILLAIVGVAASACATESLPPGELAVIFTDDEGVLRVGSKARYNLGSVFACGSAAQPVDIKLVVKNVGLGPLTLSRLDWVGGDAARIGGAGSESARWDVAFVPGRILEAAEFVEFDVSFAPPREGPEAGVFGSTTRLVLRSDDASASANSAEITFVVGFVSGECEMQRRAEFNGVVVGSTYRYSIELRNWTMYEARAFVGEIVSDGDDHEAFSYAPGSPRGEFEIPAGSSATVWIDFHPALAKPYVASALTKMAECCEATVRLTGTGVPSILTWAPEEVDCGESTVGVEVLRPLTVTNHAHFDVALWNLQTVGHSGFRVLPPAGSSPEVVLVPGSGGTATLTVGCTPTVEGLREANLSIPTSSAEMPWLDIPVRVTGLAP